MLKVGTFLRRFFTCSAFTADALLTQLLRTKVAKSAPCRSSRHHAIPGIVKPVTAPCVMAAFPPCSTMLIGKEGLSLCMAGLCASKGNAEKSG